MENAILKRYASPEMLRVFSDGNRYRTWRRIWLALAQSQKETGLAIPDEALRQMEANLEKIDLERVAVLEKDLKHDVMAHIHHFAELAPAAKAYIHLGATSCDVTDNADLILIREGLDLLELKLKSLLYHLKSAALAHKNLPCLGYTHLQPAQPITMGKRFCLWLADFMNDLILIRDAAEGLPLRGLKGATGTQASFLALFDGDRAKVIEMEHRFVERLDFPCALPVTGQTYPRKLDKEIGDMLKGIAISAGKMSRDMRMLQAFGEAAEPFGSKQVGSSAMPFKRNPMKMERATSISRFMLNLLRGLEDTAAEQFLERTLDDSALRRLTIPMGFFMADALLQLCGVTAQGLDVKKEVVARRFKAYLPFLLIETILMEWVKKGGDRQTAHEILRQEAMKAHAEVEKGRANSLFKNLLQVKDFPLTASELKALARPKALVGTAPWQVKEFVAKAVEPLLKGFEPSEFKVNV
jgi:adenylosuccinate lyase